MAGLRSPAIPLLAPPAPMYHPTMVAAPKLPPGEYVPDADQRIVLHGVPWSHYEVLLALRGDAPAPKMSFLHGSLELMNPSISHEQIKSTIGSLVEAYAVDAGIDFGAYGSWTLKDASKEAGAEADECYMIGVDQSKPRPDLAIEVIWTSGGLGKLEIYRRLGIGEVWVWKDGRIEVHVLAAEGYERRSTSAVLPGIKVELIAELARTSPTSRAIREFRARHPR